MRNPLHGNPEFRSVPRVDGYRLTRFHQRRQERPPRSIAALRDFRVGQEPVHHQDIIQFIRVRNRWPGLLLHRIDRTLLQLAQLPGVRGFEPPACSDGLYPPFLKWRVIQERIRPRIENALGHRGGFTEIAGRDFDFPCVNPLKETFQGIHVHRLVEAVVNGLVYEGMVRHLAVARDVFQAGELVREYQGQQVLGIGTLNLRRNAVSPPAPEHSQRRAGVPAPSRLEHWRIQQGLYENLANRPVVQIADHFLKRETVRGPEGEHQALFVRRRLEFEVELSAESFSKGEPPRPVQPVSEDRMDDEVLVAHLVEETLKNDVLLRRYQVQRCLCGSQVRDHLVGRLRACADLVRQPRGGVRFPFSGSVVVQFIEVYSRSHFFADTGDRR